MKETQRDPSMTCALPRLTGLRLKSETQMRIELKSRTRERTRLAWRCKSGSEFGFISSLEVARMIRRSLEALDHVHRSAFALDARSSAGVNCDTSALSDLHSWVGWAFLPVAHQSDRNVQPTIQGPFTTNDVLIVVRQQENGPAADVPEVGKHLTVLNWAVWFGLSRTELSSPAKYGIPTIIVVHARCQTESQCDADRFFWMFTDQRVPALP